jgi:micrococcal nuclease
MLAFRYGVYKAGVMKTTARTSFILLFSVIAVFFLFLSADGDTAVYVTNSGRKYHNNSCSSLRNSKIAVSLEEAVRSGYEACGICKPPSLTANDMVSPAGSAPARSVSGLYRVNAAGLKNTAEADPGQMIEAEVVSHVDGDTVRVRIVNPPAPLNLVETIRMLGVDTPETVHPSRQVEVFGKEASDFTKVRLLGKNVYLAFDWDLRDRYNRLLAYIYLADNVNSGGLVCHNAELVREGYAHAYTRFAFQFAVEFRVLEQEARREQRGLWGEAGVQKKN